MKKIYVLKATSLMRDDTYQLVLHEFKPKTEEVDRGSELEQAFSRIQNPQEAGKAIASMAGMFSAAFSAGTQERGDTFLYLTGKEWESLGRPTPGEFVELEAKVTRDPMVKEPEP